MQCASEQHRCDSDSRVGPVARVLPIRGWRDGGSRSVRAPRPKTVFGSSDGVGQGSAGGLDRGKGTWHSAHPDRVGRFASWLETRCVELRRRVRVGPAQASHRKVVGLGSSSVEAASCVDGLRVVRWTAGTAGEWSGTDETAQLSESSTADRVRGLTAALTRGSSMATARCYALVAKGWSSDRFDVACSDQRVVRFA
jgi:hypothetical protein